MSLFSRKSPESGFSAKFDRSNAFKIKRVRTPLGEDEYSVENTSSGEKITIHRDYFDRFRAYLAKMNEKIQEKVGDSDEKDVDLDIDMKMGFKEKDIFRFRYRPSQSDQLVINGIENPGVLRAARDALGTLIKLMFHDDLDHPNDTFDRIVEYHKLFQFTFVEATESINSALTIRNHILCETDTYLPSLNDHMSKNKLFVPGEQAAEMDLKGIAPSGKKSTSQKSFKSKLGSRNKDQNYTVDYENLFSGNKPPTEQENESQPVKTLHKSTATTFPIPLLASDIKSSSSGNYRVELSKEDASQLRETFLSDRSNDIYLGFEILDVIHKKGSSLKTFRYPLYYIQASLDESGRFIHLNLPEKKETYLNHLGLIQTVEMFSSGKTEEPVVRFLESLLSQKIEVQKNLHSIKMKRSLPCSDEVFEQTREILIGKPGDEGKGGILEKLKIIGIECDLESVILYKVPKKASLLSNALEKDLGKIQELAHDQPKNFYNSLLGHFLTPHSSKAARNDSFSKTVYSPGRMPRSTERLMDQLNQHDLLLLEGPPGTGKTFSIMNLFIHCLNNKKKLVIVSDKKAAISALTEKIEEFMVGNYLDTPQSKSSLNLWKSAVKVVDEVPAASDDLQQWAATLIRLLSLDLCKEQDWPVVEEKIDQKVDSLDKSFELITSELDLLLDNRLGTTTSKGEVAKKFVHPTTQKDIKDFIAFLQFIGAGEHIKIKRPQDYNRNRDLAKKFIDNREAMAEGPLIGCFSDFSVAVKNVNTAIEKVKHHKKIVAKLIEVKPKSLDEFRHAFAEQDQSDICQCLIDNFKQEFEGESKSVLKKLSSLVAHPCAESWRNLLAYLNDQEVLLKEVVSRDDGDSLLRQFQEIHQSINPEHDQAEGCAVALEVCKLNQDQLNRSGASVHELLRKLGQIQQKRDELIKQKFMHELSNITRHVIKARKSGTNLVTSISNLLEALKDAKTIDHSDGVAIHRELQDKLWEAFPVWICRKEAIPFLLPTKGNMIDLVVVDEAGQCRVHDALPLLYRAKKLMVVGDEKQTVLNKNSLIDDFLFSNYELEEHLRTTQARGVKGGGSHLFGLVKSIKETGVMLDEHYRCPPQIIKFSNEYVYNSDLKVMQWQPGKSLSSVVVDYSEKEQTPSRKPTSGRFKSIEIEMIDRFFDFVAKTIKKIEKQTETRVNVETDVALCYFLLKNEPYIKEKKQEFLQKLNRGSDVLDGAGAALQGKERKYIFYLWDINRNNLAFFRQGDDPDKRKGELNVLMSRPKVRAYHFLHHGFETLKHDTASITDYLWKEFQQNTAGNVKKVRKKRLRKPGKTFLPWQRSSGPTLFAMLSHLLQKQDINLEHDDGCSADFSVVIGDSKRKVDLIFVGPENYKGKSLGVVDLSSFDSSANPANDVIDYFFQLQRAVPPIDPVFAFMHELADERSAVYGRIRKSVEAMNEED